MFNKISVTELLIVLGICLLIFGPRALPKLGRSIGKTIHSFKKGINDDLEDTEDEEEPASKNKKGTIESKEE